MTSLTLYHASRSNQVIEAFQPFTHFGTKKAALSRACGVTFDGVDDFRLYEVILKIKNPLMIKDFSYGNHGWLRLVDALHYTKKIFTADDRQSVFAVGNISDERAFQQIRDLQTAKGFDGLSYKNWHEDPGSTSYIVLYAEQIEIQSVEILNRKVVQEISSSDHAPD
jgi:hypothetical protein